MASSSTPQKGNCPFWMARKTQCRQRIGGIFLPMYYHAALLCTTSRHGHCVHFLQELLLPKQEVAPLNKGQP